MRTLLCVGSLLISSFSSFAADSYRVGASSSKMIYEHSVCRTVTNNNSKDMMVATNSSTAWSQFLSHLPPNVTADACQCTAGSQNFNTVGSSTFTVPWGYSAIIVDVFGGGGGGGGDGTVDDATDGGASSFNSDVIAFGGEHGWINNAMIGAGGHGSGGNTTVSGGNGSQGIGSPSGAGGTASGQGGEGGAGLTSPGPGNSGSIPGGGGGGARGVASPYGSGGGAGGYTTVTYSSGALTPLSEIPVVVGAGGTGGTDATYYGGAGARGRVSVTWSCPLSTCAGAEVGGYCWYLSTVSESCSTVCASRGGCNLLGIRNYAGSSGSFVNCDAVLTALGVPAGTATEATTTFGLGCYWSTTASARRKESDIITTCTASITSSHRACACNN